MQQLAPAIFAALRRMDAEAAPVEGWPTGLRGYHAFRQGRWRKDRGVPWENSWTERMAELLPDGHRTCKIQQRYPHSRKTCDLLVSTSRSRFAWIEVKGAWPALVGENDCAESADRRNSSFVKHLNRAADDIEKLQAAELPNASHIGLLLISFPSPRFPVLEEHLQIIGRHANGWEELSDQWEDENWKGRSIQCWFWMQAVVR
jgi:hypothetical protein